MNERWRQKAPAKKRQRAALQIVLWHFSKTDTSDGERILFLISVFSVERFQDVSKKKKKKGAAE